VASGPLRREPARARAQSEMKIAASISRFLVKVTPAVLGGWLCLTVTGANDPPGGSQQPAEGGSRLIEVSGLVQWLPAEINVPRIARPGDILRWGDQLKTGANSRATLLLSDRSVVRIDQLTTVKILPPTNRGGKRRLRLNVGKLFLFDREKPEDIEFETPLTTGAIRGTEFLLEVLVEPSITWLAVLDGIVDLKSDTGLVAVRTGKEVTVQPGHPPEIRPLTWPTDRIQWVLYYPAVLDPEELLLSPMERAKWRASLEAYRRGNLQDALAGLERDTDTISAGARTWLAALKLAVGRVDDTQRLLDTMPEDNPQARALRELIASVQFRERQSLSVPGTASEWLARSYYYQSQAELKPALDAAREALRLSPAFGFAHARVAELELSFGRTEAARRALGTGQLLCPEYPTVPMLAGFMELDRRHAAAALIAFDQAIDLDAQLGQAWLGRGIACEQLGRADHAETAFQMAAALEPQRALFRSALAKAYSDRGEDARAERELAIAKRLDAADPTAWLYSALHHHQRNRPNRAVADLERSRELNDNRGLFRSRLLLDRDRAVRSANLAAIYDDAGLAEVGYRAAAQAVAEDYTAFAGHLFLANSYQALEDPYRSDPRLESARQSELLMANLLAPPGGGNLSQLLSQQDHLRFFDPRPVGASSLTEYRSNGDWIQSASVFGTVGQFSYAVDSQYRTLHGDWPNQELDELYVSAQSRYQLSPSDSVYLQVGSLGREGGDLARHQSPDQVNLDLELEERLRPFVYAGWNHEWTPGSRTLLLGAYLRDELEAQDPDLSLPFLRYSGGQPTSLSEAPLFAYTTDSGFDLYSAEAQQIWQTPALTLVLGGRAQAGRVDTETRLSRALTGFVDDPAGSSDFNRLSAYVYSSWDIIESLQLTAGIGYDHITYPPHTGVPTDSQKETRQDQISPKIGLLWRPANRTAVRAAYARSLGGLFFDNSLRLEPTQLAGLNQTFRSLVPESVAGSIPGATFDMAGLAADHSFPTHTYLGAAMEWLRSDGERQIGVMTNSTSLPLPDRVSAMREQLDYEERALAVYAHQLFGDQFAVGLRYRLTESELDTRLPDLDSSVTGRDDFTRDDTARLHTWQITGRWTHPVGTFAEWRSEWYHQETWADDTRGPSEDFWQHDLFVGYRFQRRRAEVRLGILNLTDADYRLNPLSRHRALPRERTFTADLRLNF
jgi:hypothetical protein